MTIVNSGANAIADQIAIDYRVIAIGNGGDTTSPQSTGLNSFFRKKINQAPTVTGTSLLYNVTFTGAEMPASGVSELGIFKNGSNTVLTDPPDGTLLSRVTFTNTGVVAANDTVTFQIRIEVGR